MVAVHSGEVTENHSTHVLGGAAAKEPPIARHAMGG